MTDQEFAAAVKAAHSSQVQADSKAVVANSTAPDIKTSDPHDYAHQTAQLGIHQLQADGNVPTIHDAVSLYSKALGDAQDYQKSIAQDQEKRTHLTPEEANDFGNIRKSWDVLDQIGHAFTDTTAKLGAFQGPIGGRFSGLMGAMGNPDVNAYDALVHDARPILNAGILQEGKTQSGEPSNIRGFEQTLPTLSNTPASAQSKLDIARHLLATSANVTLTKYNQAGRDLSGVIPLIKPVLDWDQSQQHPAQVGTPTSLGPVFNGISPDGRALLFKAFPQQAQSPAQAAPAQVQAPKMNPPSEPSPAQQPQQQPASDPDWMSKLFGSGGGFG